MKQTIRLTESELKSLIRNVITESMFGGKGNGMIGGDIFGTSLNPYQEQLPKGWEKIERENDETIYMDPDGNEYVKDEYGRFRQLDESDSKINEVSASLAHKAALKALQIGREGFGKYGSYYDGIPFDSYHGKKYLQGDKFLKYFHEKLGINKGYSIYYPNGTGDVMVLKDPNGNICTKPCHSIEELEMEYNKLQNESNDIGVDEAVSRAIQKLLR